MAEYLLGQHMEYRLGQHAKHDGLLGASLDRPECHVPVQDTQEGAVAVVAEGPVDLDEEDDDNNKEEAEAALAVLVGQGKEVAAEAARAPSSI